LFLDNKKFEFGILIRLPLGKLVYKDYDKFTLSTEQSNKSIIVIIKAKVETDEELEIFAYLIEYILFELSKKDNASPSHVKKYIDDWLKFSSNKSNELSIEKQIGLIGELVILSNLLNLLPNTNQLNNWQGPDGAKIDFIFSRKFGLEVKSRIQPFKDWITISSVEQLDNDLESQHLVVCDFLPSDIGKTIKEFTDELIVLMDDRDKANDLIKKLSKASYDYFSNYTNLVKVSLFRQTVYDTKDEIFPILNKSLDLRIDKIKYDININGLNFIPFTETLSKVSSQQVLN
jgi:hypothetical protein